MRLLFAVLASLSTLIQAATTLEPVERVSFDWDGDGKLDTFEFHVPRTGSKPAEYTRLKIKLSTKVICDVSVNAGLPMAEDAQESLVKAKYMAILPNEHRAHPYLMLRNWKNAGVPIEQRFYTMGKKGCPVLDKSATVADQSALQAAP